MRVFINNHIYYYAISGIFLGISHPIIINANSQISNNWFGQN